MGKRRDLPASFEAMEKRFVDAINRIKEGNPLCPELSKKAKVGKLRLTVSAVALEAGSVLDGEWKGLSRTLIGHAGCRYPKIYALIVGEAEDLVIKRDLRSVNRDLREQNRDLERKVKLVLSEMGAMARRMESLEKDVRDKVDEIMRVQARGARSPNTMPTNKIGKNVVSIRKETNDL